MKIGGKVLKKEKLRKHKFEKTPLHLLFTWERAKNRFSFGTVQLITNVQSKESSLLMIPAS
jgi:hypothetical protein